MEKQKTIKQIIGNKYVLVGLILGASVGYIGAELVYLVGYLFHGNIDLEPFLINSSWGIFLLGLWIWLVKKIQKRSLK